MIVGQNYWDEWTSFASAMGTPAGISVYGELFQGTLNMDSQDMLSKYAAKYKYDITIPISKVVIV